MRRTKRGPAAMRASDTTLSPLDWFWVVVANLLLSISTKGSWFAVGVTLSIGARP